MDKGDDSEEGKGRFKKLMQTAPYLFEDLVKTVEEGKKKLADYENLVNSSPSTANSSSTSSSSPQNSAKIDDRINQLEAKLKQTQQEIGKLGTNSTGNEDKFKKAELEKSLTALKNELESLRKGQKIFSQPPQNQSKNDKNNKLN